MVLASAAAAEELGAEPLARVVASATHALDPQVMGIAPAFAIPKALERAGLAPTDIDVWEVHEAYSAQALGVLRELPRQLDGFEVPEDASIPTEARSRSAIRSAPRAPATCSRSPRSCVFASGATACWACASARVRESRSCWRTLMPPEPPAAAAERFDFAFALSYRLSSRVFGITPSSAWVDVGESHLEARFGLWRVRMPLANISGVAITGPYASGRRPAGRVWPSPTAG